MLYLHVTAGSIGIIAGFAAMLFAKGSRRHGLAGDVYVISMLVMCTSAFIAAIFIKPNNINVLAALLTGYLVASGWMTVHRRADLPRRMEFACMALGAGTAIFGLFVVRTAADTGMSGFGLFFGGIAALCVASDLRFWRRGDITRTQRLTRHLWRMGFSLTIASGSLFLGQMRHLPGWLTGSKLNVILALAPLVLMIFWLVRVRRPPWSRKVRAGNPYSQATAP